MGACCEPETSGLNKENVRPSKPVLVPSHFAEDEYADGRDIPRVSRHHINGGDNTALSSVAATPAKLGAGSANNQTNNASSNQSSTKKNYDGSPVKCEPIHIRIEGMEEDGNNDDLDSGRFFNNQHKQQKTAGTASSSASPTKSTESASPGGAFAQQRFLSHVNGADSHAVGRVIFEQWCIFLNKVEKLDEALLLEGPQSDAFLTHGESVLGGDFSGADVTETATSTRSEKWATLHASESVTHESVEEVAKDFMGYLKEDIKNRGWGADFEYSIQGFDNSGVVTVTINLVRHQDPHTFNIVVNYHAVSLL